MPATIELPSAGKHARTFEYLPPDPPPLPSDASPEQKDLHWYTHVYRGDHVPQLTFRAVAMGAMLGMLMSVSNLYTVLKVGWSFGVAITSCVISFVIWNAFRALSGGRLTPMSILENNCMQSTASAAGASTGNTIGTCFGALLLLDPLHRHRLVADRGVVHVGHRRAGRVPGNSDEASDDQSGAASIPVRNRRGHDVAQPVYERQ